MQMSTSGLVSQFVMFESCRGLKFGELSLPFTQRADVYKAYVCDKIMGWQ